MLKPHISRVRFTAAVVAALVAVSAPVIAAGPVSAAPAPASAVGAAAEPERFWIYDGANFTGLEKSFTGSDPDFSNNTWNGSSASVDNDTSSAYNDTSYTVYLYATPHPSDPAKCTNLISVLSPQEKKPSLGTGDNAASCVLWVK
ncbi:peptidase inhibitor family I36 protein [Streptomyces sp. GMY02]|uniref:peptidase inhibitor family I36 protein n=1 Tax=Streptomyces sp. GMY02 TaxID=1333528 RepID=UPI001C2CC2E3|nr:peptidase inhibitor family I36 protein [Streptomyces sp. GMY02]QXE38686.1 peptidase inhibitor family I36 protein [Streptomyces sp. GMY02]